jgi:hypothetical protein
MKYYALLAFATCCILGSCNLEDIDTAEQEEPADITILSADPITNHSICIATKFSARIKYTFDSSLGTDFRLKPQMNFIFDESFSGWINLPIDSYVDSNGIVDITYFPPSQYNIKNQQYYNNTIVHVRFNGIYKDNNGNTQEMLFYYSGDNYYLVYRPSSTCP